MAHLMGHPSQSAPVMAPVQVIGGPTATAPTMQTQGIVIDGTPVRVVLYAVCAAAGLVALRWGGFKFNVGVSS